MANLLNTQDVDLDAILGELCALEVQCDEEIGQIASKRDCARSDSEPRATHNSRTHSRSSSDTTIRMDDDAFKAHDGCSSIRTESPDNDSAFSDTVSMLSSESSASSGISANKSHAHALNAHDKDEKIRLALEKMKEAAVKKIFIKAFAPDGSTKSLLVDEKMTCAFVTRLLADKNHVVMDPRWAVVEHLPDLQMERIYEDHELLVDNLMQWTRDSKNKIIFTERDDKVKLFQQPELFLLSPTDANASESIDYDEHARAMLLEEFFANSQIPEVESLLYLKSDAKKGWKKYQFVLRASGIYYWPKDKAKNPRDMVCLATLEHNNIYLGVAWRKKFKAPTDWCFAIKHPRLQQPKSTKFIKFLCAEDPATLERWIVALRIAKYGRRIMDNYRQLIDDLAQDDLDLLANARSCSISSIAIQSMQTLSPTNQATTPTPSIYSAGSDISIGIRSCASSSSSSGCMSDSASSGCENAFDSEFPMGTIKRKPSMKPSLPLTNITRQLKEVGDCVENGSTVAKDSDLIGTNCSSPSTASLNSSGSGSSYTSTLTRRHSRRKTNSSDDGSNSGTLKRQNSNSSTLTRGDRKKLQALVHTQLTDNSFDDKSPVVTPTSDTNSSPFIFEHRHLSDDAICDQTRPEMTESITSLPPPMITNPPTCDEVDVDDQLPPPPPPEMFRSTLSLDSLPPPPGPGELSQYAGVDCGSQLSLASLGSLPPPPCESGTLKRGNGINSIRKDAFIETNTISSELTSPTTPISHLNLNESLNVLESPSKHNGSASTHISSPVYQQIHSPLTVPNIKSNMTNRASPSHTSTNPRPILSILRSPLPSQKFDQRSQTLTHPSTNPLSPIAKTMSLNRPNDLPSPTKKPAKKITFNLPPDEYEIDVTVPQQRPPLPKRSDKTALTSPKKLSTSTSAPPKDFLKDLQRVMRKKWQVAQKCKQDVTVTPHEVLGFRDLPVADDGDYQSNVSKWVQDHYGLCDNLYENVVKPAGDTIKSNTMPLREPVGDTHAIGTFPFAHKQPLAKIQVNPMCNLNATSRVYAPLQRQNSTPIMLMKGKRAPPPPPKRSETTQLTRAGLSAASLSNGSTSSAVSASPGAIQY